MSRIFCRVKITNARVTKKIVEYEGSLGLDKRVMESAGLYAGELVQAADATNGRRFVTYLIPEEGKNEVAVYGAAAHLVNKGDSLIIMAFEIADKPPAGKTPTVIDLAKQTA